ncbi:hypothetical protein [Streptomyces sp. KL116D]|uniref:hypothetical protein n=1 Tax=Streptomyces sp. KL116D TaxID=3045152 RepID=UPI0035579DC8
MFAELRCLGFEATAIYGEEPRNPRRPCPRDLPLGRRRHRILRPHLLDADLGLRSLQGALRAAGAALASGDSSGFVFAPIADQFGGWVNDVLPILLATSLFAGILTFHNSANRYLFALGPRRTAPRPAVPPQRPALAVDGRLRPDRDRRAPRRAVRPGRQGPRPHPLSWFSGLAVLAMMLLYLLTSVSGSSCSSAVAASTSGSGTP